MSKKPYYSYHGTGSIDKSQRTEVGNLTIRVFNVKSFGREDLRYEYKITPKTELTERFIEAASNKGYCVLDRDYNLGSFYVFDGVREFIAEVEQQIKLARG